MQGTIYVEELVDDARRLQNWMERQRRERLRDEEHEVLKEYWRAGDKQSVVQAHQEVFERIKENKRRGERIKAEERRIVDEYKRTQRKQAQCKQ